MKPYAVVDTTPDEVHDEVLLPPPGHTRYVLILADDQVELLAQGVTPEVVSRRAYAMLQWKRDHRRAAARSGGRE